MESPSKVTVDGKEDLTVDTKPNTSFHFNPKIYFPCKLCRHSFPNVDQLLSHKRRKHSVKELRSIKCIVFEARFVDDDEFFSESTFSWEKYSDGDNVVKNKLPNGDIIYGGAKNKTKAEENTCQENKYGHVSTGTGLGQLAVVDLISHAKVSNPVVLLRRLSSKKIREATKNTTDNFKRTKKRKLKRNKVEDEVREEDQQHSAVKYCKVQNQIRELSTTSTSTIPIVQVEKSKNSNSLHAADTIQKLSSPINIKMATDSLRSPYFYSDQEQIRLESDIEIDPQSISPASIDHEGTKNDTDRELYHGDGRSASTESNNESSDQEFIILDIISKPDGLREIKFTTSTSVITECNQDQASDFQSQFKSELKSKFDSSLEPLVGQNEESKYRSEEDCHEASIASLGSSERLDSNLESEPECEGLEHSSSSLVASIEKAIIHEESNSPELVPTIVCGGNEVNEDKDEDPTIDSINPIFVPNQKVSNSTPQDCSKNQIQNSPDNTATINLVLDSPASLLKSQMETMTSSTTKELNMRKTSISKNLSKVWLQYDCNDANSKVNDAKYREYCLKFDQKFSIPRSFKKLNPILNSEREDNNKNSEGEYELVGDFDKALVAREGVLESSEPVPQSTSETIIHDECSSPELISTSVSDRREDEEEDLFLESNSGPSISEVSVSCLEASSSSPQVSSKNQLQNFSDDDDPATTLDPVSPETQMENVSSNSTNELNMETEEQTITEDQDDDDDDDVNSRVNDETYREYCMKFDQQFSIPRGFKSLKNFLASKKDHNSAKFPKEGVSQKHLESQSSSSSAIIDKPDSIQTDEEESSNLPTNYNSPSTTSGRNSEDTTSTSFKQWLITYKSNHPEILILLDPDPLQGGVSIVEFSTLFTQPLKCKLCNRNLSTEDEAQEHVQTCWSDNKQAHRYCFKCNFTCSYPSNLKKHLRSRRHFEFVKDAKGDNVELVPEVIENEVEAVDFEAENESEQIDTNVGQRYNTRSSKSENGHKKNYFDAEEFPCTYCTEVFYSELELQDHEKMGCAEPLPEPKGTRGSIKSTLIANTDSPNSEMILEETAENVDEFEDMNFEPELVSISESSDDEEETDIFHASNKINPSKSGALQRSRASASNTKAPGSGCGADLKKVKPNLTYDKVPTVPFKQWLKDYQDQYPESIILLDPDPLQLQCHQGDTGTEPETIAFPLPIRCKLCTKKFHLEVEARNHVATCWKYNKKGHKYCIKCDKNFFNLKSHNQSGVHLEPGQVDPRPKLKCPVCSKEYLKENNLKNHLEMHENLEKNFICEICGFACHREKQLEEHKRIHSEDRPFKCKLCPRSYKCKNSLKSHIRIHTGAKCTLCDKFYTTESALKYHMMCHTGEKPFHCEVENCNFKSRGRTQLLKHCEAQHSDKQSLKKFRCTLCSKFFSTKPSLNTHMLLHTGEKPFQCTYEGCCKSFRKKASLQEHTRVHTGETPWQCDGCGSRFWRYQSFTKHAKGSCPSKSEENESKRNKFLCHLCPRKYPGSWELKRHLKLHEQGKVKEKVYECEVCDFKCGTKKDLKEHEKIHDSDIEEAEFEDEEGEDEYSERDDSEGSESEGDQSVVDSDEDMEL